MSDFYTSVGVLGNNILFRGIVNGQRRSGRYKFQPSLFVSNPEKDEIYKTLEGYPLAKIDFENIQEAKDYEKRYKDVSNFKIYGNTNYEYVYIAQEYPKEIEWDRSLIRIANIDIEVGNNPYDAQMNKKVKIRKKK